MSQKGLDAATSAIEYALVADDGIEFLRCWNEGDYDAIRECWSDAPKSVYLGEIVSSPTHFDIVAESKGVVDLLNSMSNEEIVALYEDAKGGPFSYAFDGMSELPPGSQDVVDLSKISTEPVRVIDVSNFNPDCLVMKSRAIYERRQGIVTPDSSVIKYFEMENNDLYEISKIVSDSEIAWLIEKNPSVCVLSIGGRDYFYCNTSETDEHQICLAYAYHNICNSVPENVCYLSKYLPYLLGPS